MIGTVLFGLCFILADVVGHNTLICNESQCISCHHCNHHPCPPRMKLTCYTIVKRGGGGDNGYHKGESNCACQPEDYCDGFYPCHSWSCPDSGFIPQCNIWNHTCTCVHRDETCSGRDVSTCKITNCHSQEKLYCDHGICSCKSLNYCNQDNSDCANLSCNADLGESPFCNVTRCQCAVVVDTCQGSDTSTCRNLNCNGQFMHQICNNGVCQCQLNPSCSLAVECTETNTAKLIGTITLECKSQYGLYTDCKNGRCQCFQNISSMTTTTMTTTAPSTPFTVPTTTAGTTRSTTPQKQTTTITSTAPQQTTPGTAPQQTTTSTAPKQPTATRDTITHQTPDVVGHISICNESQCIKCHHCNHDYCPPKMKLTCYPFVKRGGGGGHGQHNGDSNCACQPEDYCDGLYPCHNWPCPDSGFIPQCNIWNHRCTCVHRDETCFGRDVSTCKITNCHSQEKLYCDHVICSCKSLNYCNQDNSDCANHSCRADLGESPFCNVTRCQCAVVVDTCQGSDTSTCQHLNCNGQFMHQICNNGVCQCQLNPSCSSVVECTETNTAMQIGTITLECKSQYGLFTDCENGRCQCFQNTSSTTTALSTPFTVPTTAGTTRSTTPQKQTTTITSTIPQPTTRRYIITQQSSTTTRFVTQQHLSATCASRMDCNQQNTHATFLPFTMPCPVDHIDCVNNKCFCSIDKITTTNKPTTTTTIAVPSISCHQCGDPDANLPCDLRTVYMGQPSQCRTGSYCMTDVVQGSDDSVAIYKRCVDELTCRNEWLTMSSDQDRCVRYGEGAVPGQYKCHYCCTVDGCNSKIVPEAKYLYSTFTIDI